MPIIHQYNDGRGHYIKSAFKGMIATYQVSPDGERYLTKVGVRDGDSIDVDKLLWMQKRGYIYTEGSGPGEIELEIPERLSLTRRPASAKQNWERAKNRDNTLAQNSLNGCSVLPVLVVVSVLVLFIILSSL